MNSLGASILGVLATLVLLSSRRWAPVWMMAGVLFLTQEQVVVVSGFNLTALRFLELVGFARILLRFETFTWCRLDTLLLAFYGYVTLVFLLRSDSGQAYAVGSLIDAGLCYLIFRALIRNVDEVVGFAQRFLVLLVPYVALLAVEAWTMQNPFGALGARTWSVLRDDRLRVMGSFRNPSLLGTLGATLLPLYIALFVSRRVRIAAALGITLCLAIVLLANSGGPVSAAAVAVLGWLCWWARHHMKLLRRLAFCSLVLVALAMHAPVWFLLERLSFLTGGSGWHRAHLLSMAAQDIDRWWYAGMDIRDTANWFAYTLDANNGGADITNAFLDFGLRGGLAAAILFVVLLVSAFKALGRALATAPSPEAAEAAPVTTPAATGTLDDRAATFGMADLRSAAAESGAQQPTGSAAAARTRTFVLWGLGCTLAAHIATWMGITYFDQSNVIWLLHLAMISSLTQAATRPDVLPETSLQPWPEPASDGLSPAQAPFARSGL